jgi:hypothetical protein
MTSLFLDRKEFSATGGLRLTDDVVVAIAAQAVPAGAAPGPAAATTASSASSCTPTRWPRAASAPTKTAWCTNTTKCCPAKPWKAGPVMLSWRDVRAAGHTAARATTS